MAFRIVINKDVNIDGNIGPQGRRFSVTETPSVKINVYKEYIEGIDDEFFDSIKIHNVEFEIEGTRLPITIQPNQDELEKKIPIDVIEELYNRLTNLPLAKPYNIIVIVTDSNSLETPSRCFQINYEA